MDSNKLYLNSYMTYNRSTGDFSYSPECSAVFAADFDERPVWEIFRQSSIASKRAVNEIKNTVQSMDRSELPSVIFSEFNLRSVNGQYRKFNLTFSASEKEILITFSCVSNASLRITDELTGLLNRKTFSHELGEMIKSRTDEEIKDCIVVYLDVLRFKVINDVFGSGKGDELLIHIAGVISGAVKGSGFGCRIGSDRFLLLTKCPDEQMESFITDIFEKIAEFELSFEITCNAGIYKITDRSVSAESAIDRAIMAQKSIKGSYTRQYACYTEELRKELITEQEISGLMRTALAEEQFVVYYQPQYNHTTGMLVGAEALVRWLHPERGLVSPGIFIPIFEKNGFITKLDMYVFEKACIFLRKCMDNNIHMVPVSINLTRYDIFSPDFIDSLENIRRKFDVPSKYIRIEITESAALGNSEFINDAVHKLHSFGYIVEMDDFGSGYSSLNILKDIDFDIIKLDMKFLEKEHGESNRGGTILSSVVRMVNWLGLPVIAEGVETVKQADFLGSIGCDYIQGYLYSKPLPEEQYEKLISGSAVGATIPQMSLIETLNSADFWSNDSMDTLIFSSFVGGAAIFEYRNGKIEILRVNKKYLQEISMNMSEKDLIKSDPLRALDDEDRKIYTDMLGRIIETGSEQECETWRTLNSSCCGEERICLRSTVQLIGKSRDHYLFYAMIRNITAEKLHLQSMAAEEKNLKMAAEQVNIFLWEYNIATKEMKPCFRCKRELGLPALIRNYPDPLFESGFFPEDYSEMYYDWMKQLENGVKSLEGVIPLTPDRIPFMVRYTTEFDETGRPIKAYGSATPV